MHGHGLLCQWCSMAATNPVRTWAPRVVTRLQNKWSTWTCCEFDPDRKWLQTFAILLRVMHALINASSSLFLSFSWSPFSFHCSGIRHYLSQFILVDSIRGRWLWIRISVCRRDPADSLCRMIDRIGRECHLLAVQYKFEV